MKLLFGKSRKEHEVKRQEKTVLFVCVVAIQAMKEVGIDIGKQKSKIITEDMIRISTLRVNMGYVEKEECPTLFINDVLEWGIEDPKRTPIEKVREIRDDIEQRVRQLAADIVKNNP